MAGESLTRIDADKLADSTFVGSVRFFDRIHSTNDAALTATLEPSELPALFVAAEQTAGRGRGENQWYSTAGALTFSLVVDPSALRQEPACWPQLSLWTALAVRDAVATFTPDADVQVKWPNDVFLRQRKCCGILIENIPATSGQTANRLVVGIGINVHNILDPPDAADSRTPNAISLSQVCGDIHIAEIARFVLVQLEESWSLFTHNQSLQRAWQPHCLLTGRSTSWQSGTRSVDGICQGIDDDGALLLTTPQAESPLKLYGGTVTYN